MLPNPPNFPYGALSLIFHPNLPLNFTVEVSVSPNSILIHHSLQPLRPPRQSHLIVSVIVSVIMFPKFVFQPLMSFRFRQKAQPNGPSHNSPSSTCLKWEWSFPSWNENDLSHSCLPVCVFSGGASVHAVTQAVPQDVSLTPWSFSAPSATDHLTLPVLQPCHFLSRSLQYHASWFLYRSSVFLQYHPTRGSNPKCKS